MKLLSTIAFAMAAMFAATFATAAPAKADNFGVYVGSNGFGINVSNYDRRYYGRYNRCRDPWYRRHHRYCWNYGGYGYGGYGYGYSNGGYYNGYYPYYRYRTFPRPRFNQRWNGGGQHWGGNQNWGGQHNWSHQRGNRGGWGQHNGGRRGDGRRGRH